MDAYAVIETGGKQYRVKQGDTLKVELTGEEAGAKVSPDRVLAVSDGSALTIGAPTVNGARVELEVLRNFRGPKVVSFKKKRRKGYTKTIGHRQELSEVKVTAIAAG
ncbi:MAG: 50S ribosomal protein L21 [Kiritimatiellae bacterium]|nr:50S ribosomal protein L21 [Kiritimatiellia bacterium]